MKLVPYCEPMNSRHQCTKFNHHNDPKPRVCESLVLIKSNNHPCTAYIGLYISLVLLLQTSLPEHIRDHILINIIIVQNLVKLKRGGEISHEK
jgi:hypothetical protein